MTDGIILLDKPRGETSFQALGLLKRRLGSGRVGHAGTLDRFADGLLVVLAGRMTRLCAFATGLDKEYLAEVTFGSETDTLDPEGSVVAEGPVPDRAAVEAVLPRFRGDLLQVPPQFSALHVAGRRAYEAARAGESVTLAPRRVTITRLELLAWEPPTGTVRVECSKGTYIRALARDIAQSVGSRAHLTALRRTRVGAFRVEDAVVPVAFDPDRHVLPAARFFESTPGLATVVLTAPSVDKARHGLPANADFFEHEPESDGTFGALSPDGTLVAVLERSQGRWRYAAVMAPGTAT